LQQTETVEVPAVKTNSIDRNYMKDSYYNRRYPSQYDQGNQDLLKMDDYMMLKMRTQIMDNQDCTTSCVARCGRLAELPRTTPDQLTKCFENTCNCRDKNPRTEDVTSDDVDETSFIDSEDEMDLLKQYFSLIHDRERVSYLILQQETIENILSSELSFEEEQQPVDLSFLKEEKMPSQD